MQRSRDWRRAQTEKKIAKRLDIVKNVWQYSYEDFERWYNSRPHRLAKWNLNCGCQLCHAARQSKPKDTFALDKELEGWYDVLEGSEDHDLRPNYLPSIGPDLCLLRELDLID